MRYATSAVVIAIVFGAMAVSAATIRVPADQPTIQAGIDAAINGDTVLVADGTYQGEGNRDLDFGGRLIVVRSENGRAATIIDCQGDSTNQHGGFFFHSHEDSTAVVEGFTISHAFTDFAAVRCSSAALTIRNCVITENRRSGIQCYNGFGLTVENCVLSKNAYCGMDLNFCRAHVTGCDIDSNAGPGIVAYNQAFIDLSNSAITGNGNFGAVIVNFFAPFHVSNCTFVGNQSGLFYDGDFPKSDLKGFFNLPVDTSNIRNCIFAFNRESGIKLGLFAGYFQAICNDLYGNLLGDFANASACPFDTVHNISLDPLFCDTASRDYHISSTSPCAPANNSCQMLMGRYDVGCTLTYLCGDANDDGAVDISDAVYLITYIFGSGPMPVPYIAGDADCDATVDISDAVYLIAYIFAGGPAPCADCPPGPSGGLVQMGTCRLSQGKDHGVRLPVWDRCVRYQYDDIGTLLLTHVNAMFNCCPQIETQVTFEADTITVREIEISGECDCTCLYDLDYRIINLTPGTYTIRVFEPYAMPPPAPQLQFTVDLSSATSGVYCISR